MEEKQFTEMDLVSINSYSEQKDTCMNSVWNISFMQTSVEKKKEKILVLLIFLGYRLTKDICTPIDKKAHIIMTILYIFVSYQFDNKIEYEQILPLVLISILCHQQPCPLRSSSGSYHH